MYNNMLCGYRFNYFLMTDCSIATTELLKDILIFYGCMQRASSWISEAGNSYMNLGWCYQLHQLALRACACLLLSLIILILETRWLLDYLDLVFTCWWHACSCDICSIHQFIFSVLISFFLVSVLPDHFSCFCPTIFSCFCHIQLISF